MVRTYSLIMKGDAPGYSALRTRTADHRGHREFDGAVDFPGQGGHPNILGDPVGRSIAGLNCSGD
jgi:hypothetical protein